MVLFSQENAPLRVFTPLPEHTVLATRLTGWERLGDSFEFTLDLVAERGVAVALDQLLGQEVRAEVRLVDDSLRHYHGIVWKASEIDTDDQFEHYEVVLKPRLARLGLVKRSRIFQNQTALDIIRQLLEPVGGADFEVHYPVPNRTYCTQYHETDLEFFLRLCGEEGISHYWHHGEPRVQPQKRGAEQPPPSSDQAVHDHRLVLTDNTTLSHSVGRIEYDQTVGRSTQRPVIRSWRLDQAMAPTTCDIHGNHFQLFGQQLGTRAHGPSTIEAGKLHLKPGNAQGSWSEDALSASRYFDGINPSGAADGQALSQIHEAQERRARILATGAAAGSVRAQGMGDCCQVMPGHAFHLTHHHRQEGHWLAVAVEHTVTVEGKYWAGESAGLRLEARIEAAPLALAQVPWPLKAKPKVSGVETAIVTGPRGQETFVDPYGRVKVRFWFSHASLSDAGSSCWVRVAQIWAGKSYGAAFWPRVGHEVVVSFEGGDPDKPVITGSVYNATNMPPFDLPENVFVSGFKTLSEGGNIAENFHLLLLSDERGAEVVHIHAEARFNTTQESSQVNMRPQMDITIQGASS
ncbi:MAG: type VI secretion system tip protein TssI/VgrG [Planctomycetota bacterium]|nr:type VI secretion system tip protein TssI/VgrG [Planctomycetota bacterium]